MAHAPGPWINHEDIGATYDANGNVVMTAGAGCPGEEGEEGRANARLIAAAPELLEACEEFVEMFKDSSLRLEEDFALLYLGVLEVIAKAKGN